MTGFDGYVLCGGASRRMGRDKALLEVDGVAMARRVADALLDAGAATVVAVGGDAPGLQALGLAHVPDRWPGEGPLGGIVTALAHPGTSAVAVVVSCDLVHPDPAAVAALVEALAGGDGDAVVPVVEGRHQWLHAAWHRRAANALAATFGAGERSVAGAAAAVRLVAPPELPPATVADADRPEDLPSVDRGRPSPSIGTVSVPEIDVSALSRALEEGAPLVDVRQPDEYEQAHVAGARLLPLGEVPAHAEELPADRTLYVICRSGNRSGRAVEFLRARGLDAVNVEGGMLAWVEAGNAVETGA